MGGSADELLAPLLGAPERGGVLVDFDGTLSPIVDRPEDARALSGAAAVLLELHARFGVVAVVSGRPVRFLAEHLPPELVLCGLYGLEQRRDGVVTTHPEAAAWRPVIDEVAEQAVAEGLVGVQVEHKGASLTLHFRREPSAGSATLEWAARVAADAGLEVRAAKMSVELHPPVDADKGTVVSELIEGLQAACYLGDDAGDLPAFEALDRFAERGGHAVRIAVETSESTRELLARSDLRVPGPDGALALLRRLAH
jgi:trehalose 6-phosphate phosphatase